MSTEEEKDSTSIKKRETFLSKLSGDEKKKFYEDAQKKAKQHWVDRRKMMAIAEEKARELLPEMLAQQILAETSGDNFQPTQKTIDKLRDLIEGGIPIKTLRNKYFADLDGKTWDKLTKWMFKDSIPNGEVLGLDIYKIAAQRMKSLNVIIKNLHKEVRALKKEKKKIPIGLWNNIAKYEEALFTMQVEYGTHLTKGLNIVGPKVKGATINVYQNTPRPKTSEPIDVTPTVSLKDLLE